MHRVEMLRAMKATVKSRKEKGQEWVKFGTWNVRGFGGRYSRTDPEMKGKCIFDLLESRGWEVAMLTDLAFPGNGVR
eukprot:8862417-Lingulodinium_polyedra.AAC.1